MALLFTFSRLIIGCMLFVASVAGAGLTAGEINLFTVSNSYNATVSVDSSDTNKHVISSNGLPDHAWGNVNPNEPTDQNHMLDIKKAPTVESTKGCLPMGKIGITKTGVSIYNPLAQGYVNAVEGNRAETFDNCDGHPQESGDYHYHKIPDSCLWENTTDNLIGVAADGYAIYGPNLTGHSNLLNSSNLDKCHGMMFGGRYIYVATFDWPYFLSCFNGMVIDNDIKAYYGCSSTSSFDNSWGYLCSCHETPGSSEYVDTLRGFGPAVSSPNTNIIMMGIFISTIQYLCEVFACINRLMPSVYDIY